MHRPAPRQLATTPPCCYYRSGDFLRSRSVSNVVLTGQLDLPPLPARVLADWNREITHQLGLEPGDVEPLPLARARTRWPDFHGAVQAMAAWTQALGLQNVLQHSDMALMACRGARYHHDAVQYGGFAFCNLFLGEDRGLDLHFPHSGQRIPLTRGLAVVFDTAQPHAVIARHSSGFDADDFARVPDSSAYFLTWELAIDNAHVRQLLGIALDTEPTNASQLQEAQLVYNGARAEVCPTSGQWRAAPAA